MLQLSNVNPRRFRDKCGVENSKASVRDHAAKKNTCTQEKTPTWKSEAEHSSKSLG